MKMEFLQKVMICSTAYSERLDLLILHYLQLPAVQPTPAATSENAIEAPDTPVGFFRKPGQKPAEKSVSSSPTSGFAALEALGFSQDMFQDAPQDVLDDIEKIEQNLQKGEELNKKCNKGEK